MLQLNLPAVKQRQLQGSARLLFSVAVGLLVACCLQASGINAATEGSATSHHAITADSEGNIHIHTAQSNASVYVNGINLSDLMRRVQSFVALAHQTHGYNSTRQNSPSSTITDSTSTQHSASTTPTVTATSLEGQPRTPAEVSTSDDLQRILDDAVDTGQRDVSIIVTSSFVVAETVTVWPSLTVTIAGLTGAEFISGGDARRVFWVQERSWLTLANITIQNGYAFGQKNLNAPATSGLGGCILVTGPQPEDRASTGVILQNADVRSCEVASSTTVMGAEGGGIYVYRGTVRAIRSTVSACRSSNRGGGIALQNGLAQLFSSTVNGNTATISSSAGFWAECCGSVIELTCSTCQSCNHNGGETRNLGC